MAAPPHPHRMNDAVTSGGTESNNIVIQQPALWEFIVLLPTEHHAVALPAQRMAAQYGCEVVYLTPDGVGALSVDELRGVLAARRGQRGLVTVAYVNNEIGTVQNLEAIGRAVRAENALRGDAERRRVWLHTDAVQAPGRVPIDLAGAHAAVDLLSLSAHKFHGPAGLGLLFSRTPITAAGPLRPLMLGGHQQGGLRPGTEAVGALVAAAAALEDACDPTKLTGRLVAYAAMSRLVWATLMPFVVTGRVLPTGGAGTGRAPHHISVCVRGAERHALVAALEKENVYASGGSACAADSVLPSHVLTALRVPPDFIQGSLRITLSHTNTVDDVRNILCPALRRVLTALDAPSSA
jgi:cysteine desulfurase